MLIGELISSYLIHSYAYYKAEQPIISDQEYDYITEQIKDRWDEVEACDHIHKHLINFDSIKSSTGYDLVYPTIVKMCFKQMINEPKSKTKSKNINDLF